MMGNDASGKSLEPGLLLIKGEKGGGVLLGSECRKCRRQYFPPRKWCAACFEPTCATVELGHEGTLASFTLVERKAAYSLIEPPYVLGEVMLPEGIRVYTTVNLCSEVSSQGVKVFSAINHNNLDSLKIGQKVKLNPLIVKRDDEGCNIVAYNFDTIGKE